MASETDLNHTDPICTALRTQVDNVELAVDVEKEHEGKRLLIGVTATAMLMTNKRYEAKRQRDVIAAVIRLLGNLIDGDAASAATSTTDASATLKRQK